jgi:hypothetical protein
MDMSLLIGASDLVNVMTPVGSTTCPWSAGIWRARRRPALQQGYASSGPGGDHLPQNHASFTGPYAERKHQEVAGDGDGQAAFFQCEVREAASTPCCTRNMSPASRTRSRQFTPRTPDRAGAGHSSRTWQAGVWPHRPAAPRLCSSIPGR